MNSAHSFPSKRIASFLTGCLAACVLHGTSSADSIAQSADFSYALTTQNDPARPGEAVPCAVTVTNITSIEKSTALTLVVPNDVKIGGYNPGNTYSFGNTAIKAGTSRTFTFTPKVASGALAPADGSMIDFIVRDLARSTNISRDFEIQSAREEELKLSCAKGSVTPGSAFSYTLAYHNGRLDPIVGAKLTLEVPAGATFASAEQGGTLSGGTIHWALGNLAAGHTGQIQVHFTAPSHAGAAMLLEARLLDSTNQILARSSDVKTVESAPVFSYVMTTQRDSAKPGEKVPLEVTLTNLTTVSQSASMTLTIPNYTSHSGYQAGDTYYFGTVTIAAGGSRTVRATPTLKSGTDAPPDGSILHFIARDTARGAAVSRSMVVQSAPVADLQISSAGGTVAPRGAFSYTLAYQNSGPGGIVGARISLPVPPGAAFASSDSGGSLTGGVVTWSLGNLPSGKTGQVQVTFTAPSVLSAAMLLDARFLNSTNQVLARASDVKSMAVSPVFAYALATQSDTARPGEKVPYHLTVTNLSNSTQSASLSYSVPRHCDLSGYDSGDTVPLTKLTVPAGASETIRFSPIVKSGGESPLDGALANLIVIDLDRGARVSQCISLQSVPPADLELSTTDGFVAPGGNFLYTLSYQNQSASVIWGAKLEIPVPAGASFVSANNGGIPINGVVRWSLGNLLPLRSGQVQVTFKAPATNGPALLIDARLRNISNDVLARATHVKAMSIAPTFAYVLSSPSDQVGPAERIPYQLTVTNLTNSVQTSRPSFTVPNFCRVSGYDAGDTVYLRQITNLAAGASTTIGFEIDVNSGPFAPPDGTIFNVTVADLQKGASVSRAIVANSAPKADLELSTTTGTIAPGAPFNYTLTYRNRGRATIAGAKLRLAIPAGTQFTAANAGGKAVGKAVGGNVEWALGNLPAGALAKVQANFIAPTSNKACLLIEAELANSSNEILVETADVKTIYSQPTFAYELTPEVAEASIGGTVTYQLKVTNLTNSTQSCYPTFRVPQGCYVGGYGPGSEYYLHLLSIPSRSSTSVSITLSIYDGSKAPATGSLVNLVARDLARGASVSHTMAIGSLIYTHGTIIRNIELSGDLNFGKVLVGQKRTKVLTIRNSGTSPLTVSGISFPAGFSGSFAGAIPVDGFKNVAITFAPTAGKTYSGNLTVTSNRTGGNHLRSLLGVGANRSILLGGNLNFGNVKVGKSKSLVLTISNSGNEPLKVTRLTLPPGFSGKFAGTIKPKATQRVTITFSPKARKAYRGSITVSSNRTSGLAKRALSGSGT